MNKTNETFENSKKYVVDTESNKKIDEELYSRQIIFLGLETMEKISSLKILIIGLRGLGIEIAKNIIVSGPKMVNIFDPNPVEITDLGSNFYLSENQIGERRDKSCLLKLSKLNKYVEVNYLEEKNIDNIINMIVGEYNVVVVTEIINKRQIISLNDICRKNKIYFIYSAVCGLSSFVFTDFGPDFIIYDENCFKKRKFFVKNIEKSEKGLVEIEWEDKHNPYIKDYVIFKDIEGMTEINYSQHNKKIFKIKQKNEKSFYIGSTLSYNDYKSNGYVEETSIPKKVSYNNFLQKLEEPFINEDYYINPRKKFIFIVFKALMKFFDNNERLPFLNNMNDYQEVKSITKDILDNLNFNMTKSFESDELVLDEKIIKNICFSSTAEIPCMTSFIGGVVCQEIIKTTGKFRPINQWEIFDFLQYSSIIPESKKYNNKNFNNKTKYDEMISVFGEEIIQKIHNLNIFLAGAGALGCELLKILALFGISNSVLVIDDDNIEISNLNRQMLFHEEHKGLNKAFISCNSAKQINKDLKCNYISKRISPENKNIFNKSYFEKVDFVLGAIDSNQGNYYLVKQCELFEKIFIKGGTDGPAGKVESFIPNITCSYNDIKIFGEEEEKQPSCTRREFPGKIEDCLDNARDLFDEYFVIIFEDLSKILKNDKNFFKLEVENSMDSYNLMNIYFNLVKMNLKFSNKGNYNQKIILNFLIKFGLNQFEKLFSDDINKIFFNHPLNATEESKTFWKNKKVPKQFKFDKEDDLCLDFLFNFLKILTGALGIFFIDDIKIFKTNLEEVIQGKDIIIENQKIFSILSEPEILYKTILEQLNNIKINSDILERIKNLKKIKFEKDNPYLGHIQFVHSYANLKAKTYKIPCCDKFYTLEYVGKIAPTTITSTAVVAGFMCLQMIGIVINKLYFSSNNDNKINKNICQNNDVIDDEELIENGLHNFSCNLKSNDFNLESIYEEEKNGQWNINDLIPKNFSRWFKIKEKWN